MAAGSQLKPDLSNWDPNQAETWDSKRAWLTLWVTTYSMILAFCTWYIVSTVAPHLNNVGFDLSTQQLYWLTSMPGLAAGTFRLIWMFLPPILGTRKLITLSSLLLLIPMVGWTLAVRDSSTSYGVLLLLSLACGIGGGIFSGYMPSTGYFFPKRLSGTATGTGRHRQLRHVDHPDPRPVGDGLRPAGHLDARPGHPGPRRTLQLHNVGTVLIHGWCWPPCVQDAAQVVDQGQLRPADRASSATRTPGS